MTSQWNLPQTQAENRTMKPPVSYLVRSCLVVALLLIGSLSFAPGSGAQPESWSARSVLPAPRWMLSAAALDGKIYAISGQLSGNEITPVVEVFDPATDTWARKADLPTPRFLASVSVVDGKIFVIGGGTARMLGTGIVEAYDPAADSWTRKASMPTPGHGLSTSVLGGKIYAIGRFDGTNRATVETYDPAADSWTAQAPLPSLRSHVCSATLGGKLYAIGGWDADFKSETHHAFNRVDAYDPAERRWSLRASMPTPRWLCSSSVIGGKIYVTGGVTLAAGGKWKTTGKLEIYDPETDTWVSGADMPTPRGWLSGALAHGKWYLVGGSARFQPGAVDPSLLNTVEVFAPPP